MVSGKANTSVGEEMEMTAFSLHTAAADGTTQTCQVCVSVQA